MCVPKSEGKGFFVWPEIREFRDPHDGFQIGQVPLCGYDFCKTPLIRVQLGLRQLGVVFNSYSYPLRLRLRGQYIIYLRK